LFGGYPSTRGVRISPLTGTDRSETLDHGFSVARQLRVGTADLHAAVEEVSDLPGSVTTLEDYGELLASFYAAHLLIETALGAPELRTSWLDVGIDIAGHGQLVALSQDLADLWVRPDLRASEDLDLGSPAEALGCLYVIEGSALGRRVLAPLLRQRLGQVPSAFFDGRHQAPHAWRQVQRALACSDGDPRAQQGILLGARRGFGVFLDVFGQRAARRDLSAA
jgi:heme oxygenase